MTEPRRPSSIRVLHAVVGFKLPVFFSNCVRSIVSLAPADELLIVDNNSQMPELTAELAAIAGHRPNVTLITRSANELANRKVGGLYEAYREIMALAVAQEFDYVHLIQGDMQMLWWDDSVLPKTRELFDSHPNCVQIATLAMPGVWRLGDDLETLPGQQCFLRRYGLTDTGIIDVARWLQYGFEFRDSEGAHGAEYLDKGFRVLCHPWPTVAQIPWPTVVRKGRQRGREVTRRQEFLLLPLGLDDIDRLKTGSERVWLEDVCIPWDWKCLTPLWNTDLSRHYYWMYVYRDVRARGLRAFPRWDNRGIVSRGRVGRDRRRPAIWRVFLNPIWGELLHSVSQRRLASGS